MQIEAVSITDASRAIVIFGGWAMDAAPFSGLHRPGYDIYAIWDYREDALSVERLRHYEEICIVAWSWGVPAAARFVDRHRDTLPLTACIAVNGTLTPVDDSLGIPRAIFNGTLAGLSERSLMKFYRRMCVSADEAARFRAVMPRREIVELADELRAIDRMGPAEVSPLLFDHVVIAGSDAIIPAVNQRRAWAGHPAVHSSDGGHLPDFQGIIDRFIHDKELVNRRFGDAASTYDSQAVVQQHVARHIFDKWMETGASPCGDILEIGAGTGYFTGLYRYRLHPRSLTLIDLAPATDGVTAADAEIMLRHIQSESLDVVAGTSTIQWFNSPGKFIAECARVLRPGGLAVLTTFASGHFDALAPFLPSPLHYYTTASISALLPDSLRAVHIADEEIRQRFTSVGDMLRHLRESGVNALSRTSSPATVRRVMSYYPKEADGSVTLTYRPLYLLLQKV